MHIISKRISFSFGHRVWNQALDPLLSCSGNNKCKHLHGHNAEVIISLQAEQLVSGMVVDFAHLNILKRCFDELLDHKFILDIQDPLLPVILHCLPLNLLELNGSALTSPYRFKYLKPYIPFSSQELKYGVIYLPKFFTPDLSKIPWIYINPNEVNNVQEYINSFVFINVSPTAENLTTLITGLVNAVLFIINQERESPVLLRSVQFYETGNSSSTYEAGH